MNLHRVEVFARVVAAGSFTGAAAALGVRTSSVSRAVSGLEAEMGIRLLRRTTRRLSLTEAGRAFHAQARDALASLEEAGRAAAAVGAEPRGLVRVTAPVDLGPALAPAIAAFLRAHPAVRVEVSLTARHVDLVKEGFDLAVRAGKLSDSSLLARKLGDSALALYAAPSYLGAAGRPRRLSDLAHHRCLSYRAGGGTVRWRLTGPRGDEEVTVQGVADSDEFSFVRAMAAAGAGIALGPVNLFRPSLEAGEVERVLPRHALASAPMHLVWPSRRFEPAAVALLRDALAEAVRRTL